MTMTETAPPAADLDPWSQPIETLDPSEGTLYRRGLLHEYMRRLRREDPVHWSPTGPTGPYWSVTRFDDIVAIETNHQVFSSDRDITVGDAPPDFAPRNFIAADPPTHDVQRKSVTPAVAPQRLADLEALIRERTANVLDSLPRGETFDWVDRVSIELTTQFLATLFDFPWEDRRLLPYWSDVTTAAETVGNTTFPAEERERILMECLAYFMRLWQERAAQPPKFDFLSLLAHSPDTRDMINDPMEFLGNLMLLIVGGNDTTRNSMSGGVIFMHENPGEFAKLKTNPELVTSAVPEIIRYQSPVAHMRRTALTDFEFQGRHIRKGDRVVMWYVSGNRDESVIERPDEFIIDRPRPRHHVAFGFGIHRCMGNRAAELQLKILWEEILKRFPNGIEVVGEPERGVSNFILGITKLPVRIAA
ncbi:MAG TPA: cytochrome P450 [Caulobacteraceae bacterium]|nr:cytochrome P450 [Caulobacteraceae bacterium]